MKRITPAMVGEALGLPTQAIRVGMQVGALDFGQVTNPSGNRYNYIIFPEKIRAVVGDKQMEKWGY